MQKKLLLLLISLCTAFAASADVALGFPGERTAATGIYVKDLRSGEVIASHNADRLLTPASIMKSLTSATVMCLIDTSMRFSTPVYLYGERRGKVWDGNLVIESSCDPSIDSGEFSDNTDFASEIVEALQNTGITTITGKVIINEDLPESGQPGTWEIEDVPWSYGAGLFGFNFRDNTMRIWPATKKTEPYDPGLIITTQYQSKGGTLIRGINSDRILAKGVNVRKPSWVLWTSMPNPARVFSHLLTQKIKEAGITVRGKATDNISTRLLITDHQSAPIKQILRRLMVVSHNMFAEAMLRLLAPGCTRDEAVTVEKEFWDQRGLYASEMIIYDGSGLSRGNKLTPAFLGNVLEAMSRDWGLSSAFAGLFPRVGEEGTVKGLLSETPLSGKLALKSGSMSGVQCFAGYKLDETGLPTHVVVIMVNSFTCRRAAVREGIEKFLLNTFPQS